MKIIKKLLALTFIVSFFIPDEVGTWGWQNFILVPITRIFALARITKSFPDFVFFFAIMITWCSNFTWPWLKEKKPLICIILAHCSLFILMSAYDGLAEISINYFIWTVSLIGLHILNLKSPNKSLERDAKDFKRKSSE